MLFLRRTLLQRIFVQPFRGVTPVERLSMLPGWSTRALRLTAQMPVPACLRPEKTTALWRTLGPRHASGAVCVLPRPRPDVFYRRPGPSAQALWALAPSLFDESKRSKPRAGHSGYSIHSTKTVVSLPRQFSSTTDQRPSPPSSSPNSTPSSPDPPPGSPQLLTSTLASPSQTATPVTSASSATPPFPSTSLPPVSPPLAAPPSTAPSQTPSQPPLDYTAQRAANKKLLANLLASNRAYNLSLKWATALGMTTSLGAIATAVSLHQTFADTIQMHGDMMFFAAYGAYVTLRLLILSPSTPQARRDAGIKRKLAYGAATCCMGLQLATVPFSTMTALVWTSFLMYALLLTAPQPCMFANQVWPRRVTMVTAGLASFATLIFLDQYNLLANWGIFVDLSEPFGDLAFKTVVVTSLMLPTTSLDEISDDHKLGFGAGSRDIVDAALWWTGRVRSYALVTWLFCDLLFGTSGGM